MTRSVHMANAQRFARAIVGLAAMRQMAAAKGKLDAVQLADENIATMRGCYAEALAGLGFAVGAS